MRRTWARGDDSSFSASVSIGVSAIVDPRVEFAHAFAVAETACKAAKDRGRNRVELYQASDVSIMQRHEDLSMAPSLRAAISENRMRLDAQLIVPLPGSRHAVPHFELLLRMIDDKGETVGPGPLHVGRRALPADAHRGSLGAQRGHARS